MAALSLVLRSRYLDRRQEPKSDRTQNLCARSFATVQDQLFDPAGRSLLLDPHPIVSTET